MDKPEIPTVRLTASGRTWWDQLQRFSPETLDRLSHRIDVATKRKALDAKTRQLIYLGVDALVTHLYVEGLELHIENALKSGASIEEIVETLQVASTVSSEGYGTMIAVLGDEFDRRGLYWPADGTSVEEVDSFRTKCRGASRACPEWMDLALKSCPDSAIAHLDCCYSPRTQSKLGAKLTGLIGAALASSPPIADGRATRRYVELALDNDATPAEVVEAVHLTSGLGAHAYSVGMPALARVVERQK